MSLNGDNFRKKVTGQAPAKFQELLTDKFQLINPQHVSVVSRDIYLENRKQYSNRLKHEQDEYNSSLAFIRKRFSDYNSAMDFIESGKEADYLKAVDILSSLGNYRDSEEKLTLCKERLAEIKAKRDEEIRIAECRKCYNYAVSLMGGNTDAQYKKAIEEFNKIRGFADSDLKIEECKLRISQLEEERRKRSIENEYQRAKRDMEVGYYLSAHGIFESLGDYKDSVKLSKLCLKYLKPKKPVAKIVIIGLILLLLVGVCAFFVFGDMSGTTTTVKKPSTNYGTLVVSSIPSGASVYIDEIYKGSTPVEISNLIPGTYTIRISKTGAVDKYNDILDRVTISSGKESKKDYTLSKVKVGGSIDVTTKPAGAYVYIDGVYEGISPIKVTGLSDGQHSLKVTLSGYPDQTYTFTTKNGNAGAVALSM